MKTFLLLMAAMALLPAAQEQRVTQRLAVGHMRQPSTQYRITAIRPANISGEAFVTGLSNAGNVTGTVSFDEDNQPAIEAFCFQNGKMSDFYGLGSAVNSAGLVAANRNIALSMPGGVTSAHAFLWQNGRHWPLAVLPNGKGNFAQAINDREVVAGYVLDDHDQKRACLWENGRIVDLSGEQPGASSRALAVNDRDDVLVVYDRSFVKHHVHHFQETPYLWSHGHYLLLTKFAGSYTYNAIGAVTGTVTDRLLLNNQGEVVAQTTDWRNASPGKTHVWLWQGGRLTQVKGFDDAYGFNGRDQVIGDGAWPGQYQERAFLWQNGRITDIGNCLPPKSGWELLEGDAINDRGQIVGKGLLHDKETAFLLTPR